MEPKASKTNPITRMPIRHLKPASYNPENRMNSEPMARLVKSIDEIGLVYPVAVNDKNEVIDGHRRLTACKELGWTTIPTVVVQGDRDYIYAETNANSMRMAARDNLTVYLKNPNAVTERVRNQIGYVEELIGRPTLEKIAKSGGSIATYRRAREIACYLERADDPDFLKTVIGWVIKHKCARAAYSATRAGIKPATLLRAINNNRQLKQDYAVA